MGIIRSINRFTNRGATRRNFEFVFGRRKTRKTNGRKRWLESKIEHRREISSCDSFVIFRARVPSSWRIKIPERSHRPGAYANDFRGKRVRRVRSPICTNTYPEINLYLWCIGARWHSDWLCWSRSQPRGGWQEQNGGGVRRKKGREAEKKWERRGRGKNRSVYNFFIPWPTFWTNTFRVSRARRQVNGNWRGRRRGGSLSRWEIPFGILISNLFKFPTTVTRERIVMEMELYGMNKSSGRILSIDIQREKEGKKRAEKRERRGRRARLS